MRHSKRALLIFGAGSTLGLVVVAAEVPGLARIASLAMALGLALLPVALFLDWRRALAVPRKRRARAKPGKRRPRQRRR